MVVPATTAPRFLFFFSFFSPVLIQVRGKGDLGSVQLKDDMLVLEINYSNVIKSLVIKATVGTVQSWGSSVQLHYSTGTYKTCTIW